MTSLTDSGHQHELGDEGQCSSWTSAIITWDNSSRPRVSDQKILRNPLLLAHMGPLLF
jgi:hypothetical protein